MEDLWSSFIERNYDIPTIDSTYDKLFELAVSSYKLDKRTRKVDVINMKTFICRWWFKNKKKFNYINSSVKVAQKLKMDGHASILHLINHRKDPSSYKNDIEDIKDFLDIKK